MLLKFYKNRVKQEDADKLKLEYEALVQGLRQAEKAKDEQLFLANPGISISFSSLISF